MNPTQNKLDDTTIRKVLFNEVSLFISVTGFILIGFLYLTNPVDRIEKQIISIQKDIDTISSNELLHIQNSITDLKVQQSENVKKINEIDKKIERILTILERK